MKRYNLFDKENLVLNLKPSEKTGREDEKIGKRVMVQTNDASETRDRDIKYGVNTQRDERDIDTKYGEPCTEFLCALPANSLCACSRN